MRDMTKWNWKKIIELVRDNTVDQRRATIGKYDGAVVSDIMHYLLYVYTGYKGMISFRREYEAASKLESMNMFIDDVEEYLDTKTQMMEYAELKKTDNEFGRFFNEHTIWTMYIGKIDL